MNYRIRSDLEMKKLEGMLQKAGIPYVMKDSFMGGKRLIYRNEKNPVINADVISDGYGWDQGFLEIQGLGYDSVPLTAEEIFAAIKNDHYKD